VDSSLSFQPIVTFLNKKIPLSSIFLTTPDPAFGFWKGAGLPILTNTAQPWILA
jgi:hypothetical protein